MKDNYEVELLQWLNKIIKDLFTSLRCNILCEYDCFHQRLAIAQEQLKFNLKCKHNNVLPKSLIMTPPIYTPQGFATARRFGFNF